MDKKKRIIIVLVILCLLLVGMGVFIFIDVYSDDETNNLIIDNHNDSIMSDNNEGNEYDEYSEIKNTDKGEIYIDNDYDGNKIEDINNDNIQNYYSEDDVVRYFENMEYEVENSKSFKENFKEYFITIVDFIFYDGEINGCTFSKLTSTTKAKIIAIALKIDSKIEEYVPGYKEDISNTTGRVYTNIKEKLVTSYMDISSSICKDNENECNKVKEIFGEVKDYCKIGWEFIKGLFKNGATKVKDWYEIYSGK